jgi:hypothetical protein
MVVGYNRYGYGYHGYYGGMADDMAAPAMEKSAAPVAAGRAAPAPSAPVAQTTTAPTSGPSHYTKTNVQEKGVDEADLVKTDGKFIYTLRNNELVIAKTWPVDKPNIVARLTFKTMAPQQLYLHGDKLVLQGYATQPRKHQYAYGSTRLIVVDAQDRARPRLKSIYDVDGGTFSSRIVGDDIYLVQNGALQMPPKLVETAQKAMQKIPRADHDTQPQGETHSPRAPAAVGDPIAPRGDAAAHDLQQPDDRGYRSDAAGNLCRQQEDAARVRLAVHAAEQHAARPDCTGAHLAHVFADGSRRCDGVGRYGLRVDRFALRCSSALQLEPAGLLDDADAGASVRARGQAWQAALRRERQRRRPDPQPVLAQRAQR